MSLETLTKQIEVDTEKQAKQIVSDAENKAKEIVRDAEKKAKQIVGQEIENARNTAAAEKATAIASAKLETKRIIEEAKEQATENAVEQAWKEFKAVRKSREYRKILRNSIEKGLKSLSEKAIVQVSEEDFSEAKGLAKNAALKKAGIVGGAIISSTDEKIIVNNSLEAFFEQKRDEVKARLYHKMFQERGE